MKIAVYPGSFDPITNGHIAILSKASKAFDKVILLLAANPAKKGRFSKAERLSFMKEVAKDFPNVEVDSDDGLTVEYCRKKGASFMIRGLRAVTDFEFEFQLSAANRYIAPEIEMVFFMADKETSFISSSTVNEMANHGVDVSGLVPAIVNSSYKAK